MLVAPVLVAPLLVAPHLVAPVLVAPHLVAVTIERTCNPRSGRRPLREASELDGAAAR